MDERTIGEPMTQPADAQAQDAVLLALKAAWQSVEHIDILHADHIAVTLRGDYAILTVGQVIEPVIVPNDSAAIERLQAAGEIPVKPLARFSIPRSSMPQWAAVFTRIASTIDLPPSQEL